MNRFLLIVMSILTFSLNPCKILKANSTDEYLLVSEKLLTSIKLKQNTDSLQNIIANADLNILAAELFNDTRKKTFWINIYNANILIILNNDPKKFDDRSSFYKEKQVNVGGVKLSFDDIEHGIIRGSKIKLSLGLLKNPFADDFEKKFRVNETDGRIHFALNCGAKSCPPVAIYSYMRFNEQIDKSCELYLKKTTVLKAETVYISSLFSWFRGDFGSSEDIINFLKKYEAIQEDINPDIAYKDYDWTLFLNNFIEL